MSCKECSVDNVNIKQNIKCLFYALYETISELLSGKFDIHTLITQDRLYYLLVWILIFITLKMLLTTKKEEIDMSWLENPYWSI